MELIRDGELFVTKKDGKNISSMALNHDYNEGYEQIEWKTAAEREEDFVIHMLVFIRRSYKEVLRAKWCGLPLKEPEVKREK